MVACICCLVLDCFLVSTRLVVATLHRVSVYGDSLHVTAARFADVKVISADYEQGGCVALRLGAFGHCHFEVLGQQDMQWSAPVLCYMCWPAQLCQVPAKCLWPTWAGSIESQILLVACIHRLHKDRMS